MSIYMVLELIVAGSKQALIFFIIFFFKLSNISEKMYHDQVLRFEQICRSMMSKADGWVKILDFSMTHYVDGPHSIFVTITKKECMNNFLWPKFLGINFPLKPT